MARPRPLVVDITNERSRHAGGHFDKGGCIVVGNARERRNRTVTILSPFAAAHARGAFTEPQFSIGQRFGTHWDLGGLKGYIASINLECPTFGNGSCDRLTATEAQVTHRQRFHEAEVLLGPVTCTLLIWAICLDETLEECGHRLGWKDRRQASAAAVERMRDALERLLGLWKT